MERIQDGYYWVVPEGKDKRNKYNWLIGQLIEDYWLLFGNAQSSGFQCYEIIKKIKP